MYGVLLCTRIEKAVSAVSHHKPPHIDHVRDQEELYGRAHRHRARHAAPGKGILAADESTGTTESVSRESTWRTPARTARHTATFCSTKGLAVHQRLHHVRGDAYEKDESGKGFADILKENGIIPGIKVDKGVRVLANTDGETVTQGMDDLGKAGCLLRSRAALPSGAVLHIKDTVPPRSSGLTPTHTH